MPARNRPARVSGDVGSALEFLRCLWELNHAMERASRSMKKRLGVTGPERLFIRVVGTNPNITPAHVAEMLRVDRSSVTPMIKKMERRRLISRTASAVDARSYHLQLTARGRQIDAVRVGTIEQVVGDTIRRSDPSQVVAASALLLSVAKKLTARMDRRR